MLLVAITVFDSLGDFVQVFSLVRGAELVDPRLCLLDGTMIDALVSHSLSWRCTHLPMIIVGLLRAALWDVFLVSASKHVRSAGSFQSFSSMGHALADTGSQRPAQIVGGDLFGDLLLKT